jgi:hypothetical protein
VFLIFSLSFAAVASPLFAFFDIAAFTAASTASTASAIYSSVAAATFRRRLDFLPPPPLQRRQLFRRRRCLDLAPDSALYYRWRPRRCARWRLGSSKHRTASPHGPCLVKLQAA